METKYTQAENILGHIVVDTNLIPLYSLTEQQQQQIINQLANLLIATIQQLNHEASQQLAQQIAEHAARILLNYDEDIAELLLRSNQSDPPAKRSAPSQSS